MKKKASVLITSIMAISAIGNAQNGVFDVHKAGNNDNEGKKAFTMQEVILSPNIRPQRVWTSWENNNALTYNLEGKTYVLNPKTLSKDIFQKEENPILIKANKEGQNVTPNKDKSYIAYTKGKSLYYIGDDLKEHLIAESTNKEITYGQAVSRFEFGIHNGIFWSNNGEKLAFYRNDESKVAEFPLLDITTRTGSLKSIKYPMAGMDSERIGLGIFNIKTGKTVWAKVTDFGDDRYLTNISWSYDDKYVFIQVLDRTQKHMHLNMYNAETGDYVKTILTEDNAEKYVEPENPLEILKGSDKYIYRINNRDGYKNLYLIDTEGNIERLTQVDADVEYVANDGEYVYYTSAEISPVENQLFRIKLKKRKIQKGGGEILKGGVKPERLTSERGWHNIQMNNDCTYYVDTYSSLNVPGVTNLCQSNGKIIKNLLTSKNPLEDYIDCEVDFGTVKSADGKYDNYYRLIKPANFNPEKKYPVILYVYGGPHSQLVKDTWLASCRLWEMYMAQKGYIVYVQDNRGTLNQGRDFEQAIHKQCGQAEMADQMVGMNMLLDLPYVDKDRIGVHGWSYGGFMTISLLTNYPEVFKVGVAGGPVIDWKWYEVMYGERYMETEATNPEGFKKTSLINRAKDLKRKLLICQGAIDHTVLWEHSLSYVRECVKNNIQLDYFPYPCHPHNVRGKDRIHLMDKVTIYFDEYLK